VTIAEKDFMKKMLGIGLLCSIGFIAACDKDDDDNEAAYNDVDRNFTMKAAMSNFAEIDAGQLAASKGQSTGIREYGTMMVADHTDASSKLKSHASNLGLPAPDSLDAEHVALKTQLTAATGRMFDSLYIHSQVKDHQTAISLFETEVRDGRAGELKSFAEATLPKLRMHKAHADSLAKNY
jgi:putative membrane protein